MRSLSLRLLLFNILLLFLPLASLLYLDTYENQLLASQENSMVQQGRILASALRGSDLKAESVRILGNLGLRVDSRIRIVDSTGTLVADSAVISGSTGQAEADVQDPAALGRSAEAVYGGSGVLFPEKESSRANDNMLYRIAVFPVNMVKKFFFPPPAVFSTAEYYSGQKVLLGPEVQAALAGRYGAATRYSSGGQVSVNLYSAIPIEGKDPAGISGAVLVSRSTYGILFNLYRIRLDIIRIFFISLLASLLISLALSFSITIPIKRLSLEAGRVLDQSGHFGEHFRGLKRKDEIGDLSRSLSSLSARLEKRISFIDTFTSDLLHELKNPMAAIRGQAELSLASPVKEEKLLQGIHAEEARMERLLQRLRELSRIDNFLEQEETDRIDLRRFIPLLLEGYPKRDNPGVRLVFNDRTDGPALAALNPDRLTQAISNPLDNALSFSPPDGTILLSLSPGSLGETRAWRISIEDSGPGIREASAGRFFERFYSERSQQEKENHSGLGLSIAAAIIRGYGGDCFLENREEGGCCFSMVLPKASAGGMEAPEVSG
ncbi:histidine kinase [Treponema sp. OttesenSCG-928-L16]|nr:histidine kinase [Treponema sp. OttesenSCG-928-L16]